MAGDGNPNLSEGALIKRWLTIIAIMLVPEAIGLGLLEILPFEKAQALIGAMMAMWGLACSVTLAFVIGGDTAEGGR